VREVLVAARLVTLTDAGGIGKTRLALAAAAGLPDVFPGGLWWVGLAAVSRGSMFWARWRRHWAFGEEEGAGLDRALLARLEGRRMLVLLDNAEHLLPDLAGVLVSRLAACDQLVVLATSRVRFQLSPERVFAVPPLSAGDAVARRSRGVVVEQSPVVEGCAGGWIGCRWRWSWQPRGCASSPRRGCWTGSIPG
jgi:predicted ATPase